MRRGNSIDVNAILNRVNSDRGAFNGSHTSDAPLVHSVLTVPDDSTNTATQAVTEEAPSLNIEELIQQLHQREMVESIENEEQEGPEEDISELVSQHMEERNIEDSVDDIPLEEEEEKTYDNVIARDETARFSSAKWFRKAQSFSITLAGLGGIGRIV